MSKIGLLTYRFIFVSIGGIIWCCRRRRPLGSRQINRDVTIRFTVHDAIVLKQGAHLSSTIPAIGIAIELEIITVTCLFQCSENVKVLVLAVVVFFYRIDGADIWCLCFLVFIGWHLVRRNVYDVLFIYNLFAFLCIRTEFCKIFPS